jgi:hypothetical protein
LRLMDEGLQCLSGKTVNMTQLACIWGTESGLRKGAPTWEFLRVGFLKYMTKRENCDTLLSIMLICNILLFFLLHNQKLYLPKPLHSSSSLKNFANHKKDSSANWS